MVSLGSRGDVWKLSKWSVVSGAAAMAAEKPPLMPRDAKRRPLKTSAPSDIRILPMKMYPRGFEQNLKLQLRERMQARRSEIAAAAHTAAQAMQQIPQSGLTEGHSASHTATHPTHPSQTALHSKRISISTVREDQSGLHDLQPSQTQQLQRQELSRAAEPVQQSAQVQQTQQSRQAQSSELSTASTVSALHRGHRAFQGRRAQSAFEAAPATNTLSVHVSPLRARPNLHLKTQRQEAERVQRLQTDEAARRDRLRSCDLRDRQQRWRLFAQQCALPVQPVCPIPQPPHAHSQSVSAPVS